MEMECTQGSMAAILARQRADTIEAIRYTVEWSASVAMVLQQLMNPSVQQDFIKGRITGTNAGGLLVSTGEVLGLVVALNDLFNPPWSTSAVKRQERAQARGYHVSQLIMESEENFDVPCGYGAVPKLTYRAVYSLLQDLVNSCYWGVGNIKVGRMESPAGQVKSRSCQQKPKEKVWWRKGKAKKKSEVSVACKPKVPATVALVQLSNNMDPYVTSAVDGEDCQQKVEVKASINRSGRMRCWFCRAMGHKKANCYMRKKRCSSCRRIGHIARYCPQNNLPEFQEQGKSQAENQVVGPKEANKQIYNVGLVSVEDSSRLTPEMTRSSSTVVTGCKSSGVKEHLDKQSGCLALPGYDTVLSGCSAEELEEVLPSQQSRPVKGCSKYDDIPLDDSFDSIDYLPFGLPPVAGRVGVKANIGEFSEERDKAGGDQVNSVLNWSLNEEDVSHGSQDVGMPFAKNHSVGDHFSDEIPTCGELPSKSSKVVGSGLRKRIPTVNLWKYHLEW